MTNLACFASSRLSSIDLFTQLSMSLIGISVMCSVKILNPWVSVLGFAFSLPAFRFGFGELWRAPVVTNPLFLVCRLGGVLRSEVEGGVPYRTGGIGYCWCQRQSSKLSLVKSLAYRLLRWQAVGLVQIIMAENWLTIDILSAA